MNQLKKETVQKILDFRDERDWKQFHNPKDLAISISLEAAELLECFQWSGSDVEAADKKREQADELADVLIYSVLLADRLGLDITEIVERKLASNAAKYPAELAVGSKKKYTELKTTHRDSKDRQK